MMLVVPRSIDYSQVDLARWCYRDSGDDTVESVLDGL
jgi:hypothetical protein